MKLRSIFLLASAALMLDIGFISARAETKPVMIHYMPWYVAKPFSGSWGWHWTMNHFNPDTTNASGQRQIASQYYPLIGPYDSADPVVLEYHVLLMKLAGIDGVIVDWYGMDNYVDYGVNNQRTLALFNYTRKAGLKFSLCYEDATIQNEINGGYITSGNAVTHAQQTMLYAQTNFFTDTSYLQWSNKPVLLNFGPQYFKMNSDWQNIFSALPAVPAFFTEDNRLPVGAGAFNWPPMWASQTNGGVLSPSALQNYLANFQQSAASWPGFVSSAFPRFHDIYEQAGLGFTYGLLADNNGDTFRSTLSRALTNSSDIVQIVTWNDYGEGTVIEPTAEFGYRDLGIVQDFRRQYVDANFPYRTNDLSLASRLYKLRRQHAGNSFISAELDRVFTNIISGNLTAAKAQLTGVESSLPVIYDMSLSSGLFQFSIGGFASFTGAQIQTTSNLAIPNWETINSFPAGTGPMIFNTLVSTQGAPAFFKVRSAGP